MINLAYLPWFTLVLSSIQRASAYPLVAEIDIEKCYTYNVPEDDDAHMAFVVLPDELDDEEKDDKIEGYWIDAMNDLAKEGGEEYPEKMEDIPEEMKSIMGNDVGKTTRLQVKIQRPTQKPLRKIYMKYHTPVIITDVEELAEDEGLHHSLSGWQVCFTNQGDEMVRVIFDVVLYSEETEEEKKKNHKKKKIIKKEHLTPLENNFNEALVGAERILSEMRYMERREQRMRHTADSTNRRVRHFSYLSVFVLMGTAWVQISYLKNYFQKKKTNVMFRDDNSLCNDNFPCEFVGQLTELN